MFGARPHHVRRRGKGKEEEEDASKGLLGPDFDQSKQQPEEGAILLSEVWLLLQREMEKDRSDEPGARDPLSMPVFQKCHDYVSLFSKFKDEDSVRKIRQELIEYEDTGDDDEEQVDEEGNVIPKDEEEEGGKKKGLTLSRFEMAQIVNLSVEDVDEAKTLVPTLASKDDAQLEALLNELAIRRRFGAV